VNGQAGDGFRPRSATVARIEAVSRPSNESTGAWREYHVLQEIRADETLSQRKLSERLGLAVASTNQIVKQLVRKGYVTTRRIDGKSLAYSVTPQGFSRMVYHVINYTRQTVSVFADIRSLVRDRLAHIKQTRPVKTVAVIGTGELAEAVYLCVQEARLDLVAVYASNPTTNEWFGNPVQRLDDAPVGKPADIVVATEPEVIQTAVEYGQAVAACGAEVIDVYQLLSEPLSRFARHMATK
jgi:DNA-binding MarR family transcriptional regulator